MCFSPEASFLAAAATGGGGILALSRVSRPSEILLALIPILFALQQGIEGLLWLDLSAAPPIGRSLALAWSYLLIAQSLWPVFVPAAAFLIEPRKNRSRMIIVCLALGLGVGAFMLNGLLTHSMGASIVDGHIVYDLERPPLLLGLAYLAATAGSLILSSHRAVSALGALILVGAVIAFAAYWEAFESVWCFFAAAASAVILGHFEFSRRQRLRSAGA